MKKILILLTFITSVFSQTGNLIWEKTGSELPGDGYSWSTPLVMDGNILWVGQDKGLVYLDILTGQELWRDTTVFSKGSYDSPVGFNEKIFLSQSVYGADSISGLYCLSAADGSVLWSKLNHNVAVRSMKPINKDNGYLYFTTIDTLFCVNSEDGAEIWKKAAKINNLMLNPNGTSLYVAYNDAAKIEVLNASNGDVSKTFNLNDAADRIASMAYTSYNEEGFPVETIILIPTSAKATTYAIDVTNEKILWESSLIGYAGNYATPAILDSLVFAGTKKQGDTYQKITAFVARTGEILWQKNSRDIYATNSPYVLALDGKVLYENSATADNLPFGVICADAVTGDTLWTSKPSFQNQWPLTWGSPVLSENKLFIAKDGEGIFCYDTGIINGSWPMLGCNIAGTNNFYQVLVTNIENEISVVPEHFSLGQNYPNPFNPSTKISFAVAEEGNIKIKVLNILGETVAELINEKYPSGKYTISFNAGNLPSGIYFYTLEAENYFASKKMVLVK